MNNLLILISSRWYQGKITTRNALKIQEEVGNRISSHQGPSAYDAIRGIQRNAEKKCKKLHSEIYKMYS